MNNHSAMDSLDTAPASGSEPTSSVPRTVKTPSLPTEPRTEATTSGNRRSGWRIIVVGMGTVAVVAAGFAYYSRAVAPFESTDDAFIEAHVATIAPQVAGRVTSLLVEDNHEVRCGDVLLKIDPADYQVKLDQAHAELAAARGRFEQAEAQLKADQAKVEQEAANLVASESEFQRAAADDQRYQAVGGLAISKSQLDLAATQARSARAQVDAARNKKLSAESEAALDQAAIQTAAAEIHKSEAAVQQAELDLSYTEVKAPADGYVTHRSAETGAYVQAGQALLALVPKNVWVIANFKETQLTHIRPGQPVDVRVDAYPQIKFSGRVDSIQAGSGARFSLLPPENASGNYVKVVQRVPVKIALNLPAESGVVLGPGMSVEPKVRVY